MIVYIYDSKTGEYLEEREAIIDPRASERLGKNIYLQPACGTFIEPPKVNKSKREIAVFKDDKWVVEHDYRGCEIYDAKTSEVKVCDYIGDLDKAQFVTEGETPVDYSIGKYVDEALNKYIEVYDVTFKSTSIQDLLKLVEEHSTATDKILSRDDLNQPYLKTITEIKKVIKYLGAYRQLVYIKKWKKEKELEQQPTDNLKERCLKNYKLEVTDEEVKVFLNYSKEERAVYLQDVYNLINR